MKSSCQHLELRTPFFFLSLFSFNGSWEIFSFISFFSSPSSEHHVICSSILDLVLLYSSFPCIETLPPGRRSVGSWDTGGKQYHLSGRVMRIPSSGLLKQKRTYRGGDWPTKLQTGNPFAASKLYRELQGCSLWEPSPVFGVMRLFSKSSLLLQVSPPPHSF